MTIDVSTISGFGSASPILRSLVPIADSAPAQVAATGVRTDLPPIASPGASVSAISPAITEPAVIPEFSGDATSAGGTTPPGNPDPGAGDQATDGTNEQPSVDGTIGNQAADQTTNGASEEGAGDSSEARPAGQTDVDGQELTPEEVEQLQQLQQRDREVRQHEQAHLVAAGQHAASGPSFQFQTGPNGQRFAVGGEVQIDTSEVPNNPQATIAKMQQVRRAALAPADPSSQDRRVAASATQREAEARRELQEQRGAESDPSGDEDPSIPGFRVDPGPAVEDARNIIGSLVPEFPGASDADSGTAQGNPRVDIQRSNTLASLFTTSRPIGDRLDLTI